LIGSVRFSEIDDLGCFELSAGRHLTILQVTPQSDQQLAGHGHNADLAQALAAVAEALLEPEG